MVFHYFQLLLLCYLLISAKLITIFVIIFNTYFIVNFDSVEYGCCKLVLKSGCYAEATIYNSHLELNCIYY
jgi:hypothetical protein